MRVSKLARKYALGIAADWPVYPDMDAELQEYPDTPAILLAISR